MPYTPVTYNTGAAPGLDGPAFNQMETQYTEAINSFEQDLLTPFVFGAGDLVATKDGTTASRLDVTAGVAFLKQTDSTLRRRAPSATNFSTSGHPSTTMFLDLNPDGSWSWATSHSATTNHLTIATVTTDSSANIATVTDTRTLNTTLLSGLAGVVGLGKLYSDGGGITSDGAGNFTTTGSITAATFLGPVKIDTEGSNIVIRPQPTSDALIIQVNGYNTAFNANSTITTVYGGNTTGILAQMTSNGGGAAGMRVWQGTADPGTLANEGDVWAAG